MAPSLSDLPRLGLPPLLIGLGWFAQACEACPMTVRVCAGGAHVGEAHSQAAMRPQPLALPVQSGVVTATLGESGRQEEAAFPLSTTKEPTMTRFYKNHKPKSQDKKGSLGPEQ